MRRTPEQMQAIVVEWESSGLSKKAFCRDRNITYQTFHYWCKRLSIADSCGFEEVSVGEAQSGLFQVIFPSGVQMNFQGQPSAAWLRELLK